MDRKEFMELSRNIIGGLYDLKQWLYTPNPNCSVLPIILYRNEKYSELYELMTVLKKEPLIIFSDIDPFGEEDWS